MIRHWLLVAVALLSGVACACRDSLLADEDEPPLAGDELCVTSGQVGDEGTIDGPSVRAVVPASGGDEASLQFAYSGPSPQTRALASGQVRRQVGIKLRAQNSCNVLYAMWRFEPGPSRIEVSVKRNAGSDRHDQCGNKGYTKIRSSFEPGVRPPEPGREYRLRAVLDESTLSVTLNGELVWRGSVGDGVLELRGLAGLRTDNVALERVSIAAKAGESESGSALPARCRE